MTFPPSRSSKCLLRHGHQDIRIVILDAIHPGADGVPLGGETYLGHKRRCPTQR